MADNGDGQDAYDTPNRESPTPEQGDDQRPDFSRGGPDDNPPERDSVEIPHEGLSRGFEWMRKQRDGDD